MKFIGEKVDNDNDSLGDHNALIMRPMNEFFGWLNNCGQARPIGNKMDHRHSSEPGSGLWCQGWTRSSGNTECLTHITYLESSQPFSYWYFVIICNKREMRANDPCSGAVIHHTSHKSRGNIKLGGARVFINISPNSSFIHCYSRLEVYWEKIAVSERENFATISQGPVLNCQSQECRKYFLSIHSWKYFKTPLCIIWWSAE